MTRGEFFLSPRIISSVCAVLNIANRRGFITAYLIICVRLFTRVKCILHFSIYLRALIFVQRDKLRTTKTGAKRQSLDFIFIITSKYRTPRYYVGVYVRVGVFAIYPVCSVERRREIKIPPGVRCDTFPNSAGVTSDLDDRSTTPFGYGAIRTRVIKYKLNNMFFPRTR